MRPELQRRSSHASGHHHTAGVVVIGDEILAAKVDDENTAFLCAQLHAIGWRVRKVRTQPGSFLPPAPPAPTAPRSPTLGPLTIREGQDRHGWQHVI